MKIWNTTTFGSRNQKKIEFHVDRPRIELIHNIRDRVCFPPELGPKYIYFKLYDLKSSYKASMPNLFVITGGLTVVSQRFRDLLSTHNLGPTRFLAVPLYEYDQETQRPGRWFVLQILAEKPTLVPEKSEWVSEAEVKGNWLADPAGRDVLAVRADSAEGADLWVDPVLTHRIFLSDRLKRAISESEIVLRHMPFKPCVVVE